MKRILALLLAAVLTVSSGLTAYAAENSSSAAQEEEKKPGKGKSSGRENSLEQRLAAGQTGQVDVSIGAAMILESPVEFRVELKDAQNKSSVGTITLGGNGFDNSRVSFEGLAAGQYTLTVSAEGFAAWTQNLTVEDRACAVNLTTGFLGKMNYAEGGLHPGVLLIGDVNGDGKTDEEDRTALVNIIAGGMDGNEGLVGDLNGDGVVDLVDLEYFSKGYGVTSDTAAWVEEFVPVGLIAPSAGTNTKVEGSLEDLLKGRDSVTVAPESGGGISKDNPVSLNFEFSGSGNALMTDGIIIGTPRENPVKDAVVDIAYTDENGVEQTVSVPVESGVMHLLAASDVRADRDASGNIMIYLGTQVAVKKVTFTILGMHNNNNLAEISKVEFVNGMEQRIPEPEMDIPENLTATAGSRRISLSWDPCVNITGYEVQISQGDVKETVPAAYNGIEITSFQGKELVNYQQYQVRVQSVNGAWRSGYGPEISVEPKPAGKPDTPDGVSASGRYRSIAVSWKKSKDALTYNLFYKESSAGEYQKVSEISDTGYVLDGLKDLTEYTVYVTAVNELGESGPSLAAAAVTTDANPAVMPKYNLINVGEAGQAGAHIIDAKMWGTMQDSPLDTQAGTAWGTVDHDAVSCYVKGSWDDGGYNPVHAPLNSTNGLYYEFDKAYKIDTIAFHDVTSRDTGLFYAKARYWDESGNAVDLSGLSMGQRKDADGRIYYVLKLAEPVEAKKFQFGLARYQKGGNITVSEVYFYYYDTLMDEIMSLYEDDLHTVLRPDVTQAVIDALRERINTIDPVSGEYHPDRALLEKELQTAEAILNDTGLSGTVRIHNGITTNDVGRGFGGLNAWQPIGVTAAAGEEIMVYVGHSTKKTGQDTELQLIATQYHAESGGVATTAASLKVGANKVTVPKIGSTTGVEGGGALYIQYSGNGLNGEYAVRVSGGAQVPVLDLYQVKDAAERLKRAEAYVAALEEYVGRMEQTHGEVHGSAGPAQVNYAYDEQNCILGASDILLDTMMLSLPAKQMLAGAGSGTTQQKAQTLVNSMQAMEDMMYLFYQHKGLNDNASEALNRIPRGHLNIRYQRMFAGAFMYAAGNHIGIEWGSAPGMTGASSVVADADGRWQSGRYFGWGIAHEIGHCINQGTYAVAEITNNYFAVLAQAQDNNDSVRFKYEEVYKKVTSGAKGRASNVFTQLGMYWQLHLAYDRGYNYKTYENYEEQLAGLFFARVDTYARDSSKAPAPGGVKLTLAGDRDQDLMRLGCAAAEKNILAFFERWGMTPDEATRSYAKQFAEETRAIYYANDNARVYALQGAGSALGAGGETEAVGDGVTAQVSSQNPNQVDFALSAKNIPEGDVLGYEIVRCMYSGGQVIRETAGFATGNTFSDRVFSNNRVVWYEVTVIDKYLNRSAVKVLPSVKIGDDGSMDKTFWTVAAEGLTADPIQGSGTDNSPCEPEEAAPETRLLDQDGTTAYRATVKDSAAIVLEFNKKLTVAGFKYTGVTGLAGVSYEIQVRSGDSWIKAAEGSFGQGDGDSQTVYFSNSDKKYVSTYETNAVRLVLNAPGGSVISIGELDVLGVTGDNVEFEQTLDGTAAIGRLAEEYRYGTEEGDVIPAGSVLFTGTYKGNPAYNVVVLYDENGNIVGGTAADGSLMAQQTILADVPDEGQIQNVSEGTWLYWIEPEQQWTPAGRVRAELYRVNNALTNEGQRLVSDSMFVDVPAELPDITLSGGSVPQP